MSTSQGLVSVVLAAGCVVALVGCGSGGGVGTTTALTGQGRVSVAIQFPSSSATKLARQLPGAGNGVPIGSNSVLVEIMDPANNNTLAPSQIIATPSAAGGTATVTFSNIRVGWAWLRASAYSTLNASGSPIGYGQTKSGAIGEPAVATRFVSPSDGITLASDSSADVDVTAGSSSSVTLDMVPLVTSISITGSTPALTPSSGVGPYTVTLPGTGTDNLTAVVNGYNPIAAATSTLSGLPLAWTAGNTNYDTIAVTGAGNPPYTQLSGAASVVCAVSKSKGAATGTTSSVTVVEANSGLDTIVAVTNN